MLAARRVSVATGPICFESDGACGHGRRYRGGAARRLPCRELAEHPQDQHTADEVVQVEAWQVVLSGQLVAEAQRERAADDDTGGGDQAVLHEEMPRSEERRV